MATEIQNIHSDKFCDYGCGLVAVHQFQNGKWCCNKNRQACPKLKNIGRISWNTGLTKETDKRVKDQAKKLIGRSISEENKKSQRFRMLGDKNPRYGKPFKHSEESLDKYRKTMEDRGHWVKRELLNKYLVYRREVDRYTEVSIKEKYSKEELKNRGRILGCIQIDHIFSVISGFNNNINPKIISCKSNLRILTITENTRKQGKCEITKDELIKKYSEENKNVR